MAAAAILGIFFLVRDSFLVSVPFLLSFFWIFGEGLALLRLSLLHEQWTDQTWISFTGFYLCFMAAFHLAKRLGERKMKPTADTQIGGDRLYRLVIASALIPFGCFVMEAVILGYIPLFARFTHAYDHFHISGLHYFTVSSIFTPALTVILLQKKETGEASGAGYAGLTKSRRAGLILANLLSLMVPFLIISKLQLMQTIALAMIVFFCMNRDIPLKRLLRIVGVAAAVLAGAAVVMTLRRNYAEGYLDSIFQMRNPETPIALQYVYMYIANNYANFNVLTQAVGSGLIVPAMGMRQLFPVFALTGLKFIRPELVYYPIVTTIQELNTLTVIYDAYYDFGIAGVLLFGMIFGGVCGLLTASLKIKGNPVRYLFYAQAVMYVILSFFSAWFSVPTTWFYFVLTALGFWYLRPRASH